jgi:hypothetical protein
MVIVEKNGTQERVDADVYLWNGDSELSHLPEILRYSSATGSMIGWMYFPGSGMEFVG